MYGDEVFSAEHSNPSIAARGPPCGPLSFRPGILRTFIGSVQVAFR
jgi:hypothetical protein